MMISSRQPKSRIKILGDKNDVEEITNNGATTPKGVLQKFIIIIFY